MNPWLLSVTLAYLLGSIPFGYLLVRFFLKQDIRASGSGNIGATNVARSGAKGLAILTLLLDLGKGVAAVVLSNVIVRHMLSLQAKFPGRQSLPFEFAVAAGVAAVLGHVFPFWLGFRGGKGVATALGVFLTLSPRLALCILVVFLVVVALSRYVSLASVVASATVPVFVLLLVRPLTPFTVAGFCFIALLVIAKHHANIGRLLKGTESRFGSKKKVVIA